MQCDNGSEFKNLANKKRKREDEGTSLRADDDKDDDDFGDGGGDDGDDGGDGVGGVNDGEASGDDNPVDGEGEGEGDDGGDGDGNDELGDGDGAGEWDVAGVIEHIKQLWPDTMLINGRARHPQSQGVNERGNRSFKEILRKLMQKHDTKCYLVLKDLAVWHMASRWHSSTKTSPFVYEHGQKPRLLRGMHAAYFHGISYVRFPRNLNIKIPRNTCVYIPWNTRILPFHGIHAR